MTRKIEFTRIIEKLRKGIGYSNMIQKRKFHLIPVGVEFFKATPIQNDSLRLPDKKYIMSNNLKTRA